jgi:DNA-binding response OmpR family regulator
MKKILIVDDDRQLTNLLSDIVKIEGHEPFVVNESVKAVETAREVKPDLVLLDLMMPEPNGFEVCRALRADELFKNIPILIITAMDSEDSKAIAMLAGANDYLAKPFTPTDVLIRINSLIG